MQFDREKLKEVVLYIANRCPSEKLGAVKMHKVLYFCDMLRFAETGRPLTGATYRKRPNGPTCEQLLQALRELVDSGALEVSDETYFGYLKKRYAPQREADLARFTADEIALMDELIDFVCLDHTAKTISDFSHRLPWDLVEFGDVIEYESSFLLFPSEVSEEAMTWGASEAAGIEAARSNPNSLDLRDHADFRSRVLEALGR
jgi:hypothetical protein